MQQDDFKYFAFISYSSKDTKWGRRVQQKLEHYRMPATLCSEHGWKRTPIKPIFFAPTDIQPGGLTEELQHRLRSSRHLIVICSPHSAQSEWVGREIEFFHGLGRTKQIHFFIVDGQPHSDDPSKECFNPVVARLGLPEILGANIHEQTQNYPFTAIPWPLMNKERAYVQLVSKLLGVEFDTIWQRHRRRLLEKAVAWTIGIILVLAALIGVWANSQPFGVKVSLREASVHNDHLPPLHDAVVTIVLDNETKTGTIGSIDGGITFANIPHRFLGREVHVSVACPEFMAVDTMLQLTRRLVLNVRRNAEHYGRVSFRLYNPREEEFCSGIAVEVAGQHAVSDSSGRVTLFVPLEQQRQHYRVVTDLPLERDSVFMPCGEEDVVEVK